LALSINTIAEALSGKRKREGRWEEYEWKAKTLRQTAQHWCKYNSNCSAHLFSCKSI